MITMNLTDSLILCLVLASVLSTSIALFVQNRAELRRLDQRVWKKLTSFDGKAAESELRFNILESQLTEMETKLGHVDDAIQRPPLSVLPNHAGPTHGKRTAIIRLAQKGARTEQIAVSVGMPKNEVDLLLKVHRAVTGTR